MRRQRYSMPLANLADHSASDGRGERSPPLLGPVSVNWERAATRDGDLSAESVAVDDTRVGDR